MACSLFALPGTGALSYYCIYFVVFDTTPISCHAAAKMSDRASFHLKPFQLRVDEVWGVKHYMNYPHTHGMQSVCTSWH